MDDENLKNMFNRYDPELSSDSLFMDKLRRNLNSVEIIRQENAKARSRNKRAVAIAASVGFVVGVLFSLALPYVGDAVNGIMNMLPQGAISYLLAENYQLISWVIIGAVSVTISLNTYDLALSLMRKQRQPSL